MVIEHAVVGKRLPMVDGKEKVSGGVEYIADMTLPGMLHGKVLRSPHPHARILHIDTAAAERVKGVRALLTGRSTPQKKFGISILDELPFCADKVRYVGDEVAGVAADSEEAAEEALSKLIVEYEELSPVTDPLKALEPSAPLVHEDKPGNVAYAFHIDRGDADGAFRRADRVFEGSYRTHLTHQAYLEPTGAAASYENGRLKVWGCLQSIYAIRPYLLSRPMDIPVEDIQVIQTRPGGAFGGKLDVKLALLVSLLSRAAGAPVKCVLTLEEDLISMRPRMPALLDIRSAFAKDGRFLGKIVQVAADNGAYCSLSPQIMSSLALRTDSLYRTPAVRIDATLAYTNTEPTGQMRGFGNLQATFAWESHLDEVAEGLGIDPVDLRLKNFTRTGDTSIHGWKIISCGVSECLRAAAEAIGWKEVRSRREPGRGVGLACCIHVTGNRGFSAALVDKDDDPSETEVAIRQDGLVEIRSGECDLGEGAATVMALVAAEELGLPYEDMVVAAHDTAQVPFGLGAFASRITLMAGSATREAARKARQKLVEAAAEALEARPEEIEIHGRSLSVRGAPARSMTAKEVVRSTGNPSIAAQGRFQAGGDLLDPKSKYGNASTTYSFSVHAADVTVDLETGEVRVNRVVAAHDPGKVINVLGAEGQVEGGAAQGAAYALLEELVKDASGKILNNNFEGYLLPTSLDAFDVQSLWVETIDPVGPFGAKGLAETAINPTPAAVANAVHNATGVRVRRLPITPEKIVAGLQAGKDGN
ncbi:MAG: xanthine dehydrogenase family protein molybdopterin-binding subunit [Candidatus Tectomicrobia bacterium]|nr:xanthine dehydrogenase family protein molybdopterin-binding subunit [Candidatus Tectomicrobia bacterium]